MPEYNGRQINARSRKPEQHGPRRASTKEEQGMTHQSSANTSGSMEGWVVKGSGAAAQTCHDKTLFSICTIICALDDIFSVGFRPCRLDLAMECSRLERGGGPLGAIGESRGGRGEENRILLLEAVALEGEIFLVEAVAEED